MKKYLLLLAICSMSCFAAKKKEVSPTKALIAALNKWDVPAIYKAIEAGADVNYRIKTDEPNGKGKPILGLALHYGVHRDQFVEVVRALIQAGADVNTTTEWRVIEPPILWALPPGIFHSKEEIKEHQEAVKKTEARNALNVPLLSQVIIYTGGSHFPTKDVFNELIKAGADVNARALGVEWTPLMIAAFHGELEAVKGLLKAGADKTLQNPQDGNKTALDYAKENFNKWGDHKDIITLLQRSKPKKVDNKKEIHKKSSKRGRRRGVVVKEVKK